MKIFYAVVLVAVAVACQRPDSEPVKKPSGPVWAEISWNSIADSCTFVLVDNFLDKKKGTFWASPGNAGNDSEFIYWQQAHALDVLVWSYERIKDSNPELAAEYRRYFELWFDNDANNYNDSRESDGVHGGFYNAYTDDMCWICLTMMHLSEALGDDKYATVAKAVYDNYIIPRKVAGGGLPWTNEEGKTGQNACTNSPGCLLAAKLYVRFQEERYLDDALELYSFMYNKRLSSDFRVEEPPLTYTQGTFGEACRQLYHITGDRKYMDVAERVLQYAFVSDRCTTDGLLRSEGESVDQSIFKAVLIPYAVNYCLDEKGIKTIRDNLKNLIETNAKALNRSLERSAWPQMYANYYWGKPFDRSKMASMGAQTSGASLMEGIARLKK